VRLRRKPVLCCTAGVRLFGTPPRSFWEMQVRASPLADPGSTARRRGALTCAKLGGGHPARLSQSARAADCSEFKETAARTRCATVAMRAGEM
jgi:hypothetical protein